MPPHGETGDDNGEEGQTLEDGGKVLNLAAKADALPLEQGEDNDDGDGSHFDFVEAVKAGEEVGEIFADHYTDGAGSAAGGEPVGPTDNKSREIA